MPVLAASASGSEVLAAFASLLATVVTVYLIPYLKAHAAAANAAVATSEASRASTLRLQVEGAAYTIAANIAEAHFPQLAKQIVDGELSTPEQIKQVLYEWGHDAKDQLVKHYGDQGVDLVKELGVDVLDSIIAFAANRVSPTPAGTETSQLLSNKAIAQAIVDHGIDFVKNNYADILKAAAASAATTASAQQGK